MGEEWLKGEQRNLGSWGVSGKCPKASSKSKSKSQGRMCMQR